MSEPPQLFGKPRPEPQLDPQLETRAEPQPEEVRTASQPETPVDPQLEPLVDPQLALPQPEPEPQLDPRLATPQSEPQQQHQQESGEVLPEFPKKRRGRPPGRPNTTVRESDYQSNPSVQLWNSAKIDRPIAAVAINIRQALTEATLVHDTQRAIFRLPSREFIHFVHGWITARHIASQRPSYVNGLLIHSRGRDSAVSCAQCVERRAKNALGPFLTCRVLPETFHNSCSNCKWFDNTSLCSLYTGPKPNRKRKAREAVTLAATVPTTENSISASNTDTDNGANAQQENAGTQQTNADDRHANAYDPQENVDAQQANDEPEAYAIDAQLAAQLLPHISEKD